MESSIQLIASDLFGVVISEGHMVSNVLMPLLDAGADKQQVKSAYQQYTMGNITENAFWQGIGFADHYQREDDKHPYQANITITKLAQMLEYA